MLDYSLFHDFPNNAGLGAMIIWLILEGSSLFDYFFSRVDHFGVSKVILNLRLCLEFHLSRVWSGRYDLF
jgi:hypothetical protein